MVQRRRENKLISKSLDPDLQSIEQQQKLEKKRYLNKLLSLEKIDLQELRAQCMTEFGLIDDEMRRKIWPILLNVDSIISESENLNYSSISLSSTGGLYTSRSTIRTSESSLSLSNTGTVRRKQSNELPLLRISTETEWKRYIKAHRESAQIQKDIDRSLNSFDICKSYEKTTKQVKRDQLNNIIHAVLVKNPDLYYYQGFHDFVSVFLLTLGENMGFYCVEAASRFLIKDYMLENFEPGIIPALYLLMKLLKAADEECYEMISAGGDIPTFSLSWILTWYSHDLLSFKQVQRIFDACLSQHPLFALYLTVSTILFNKERLFEIYDEDDPQTSLYMVFQKINPNAYSFDVDLVITRAAELITKITPHQLLQMQDQKFIFKDDSPFLNYEHPRYYITNQVLQPKIIEKAPISQRSVKNIKGSQDSDLTSNNRGTPNVQPSRYVYIDKSKETPSKIESIKKVAVQTIFIGLTVAVTLYSMAGPAIYGETVATEL